MCSRPGTSHGEADLRSLALGSPFSGVTGRPCTPQAQVGGMDSEGQGPLLAGWIRVAPSRPGFRPSTSEGGAPNSARPRDASAVGQEDAFPTPRSLRSRGSRAPGTASGERPQMDPVLRGATKRCSTAPNSAPVNQARGLRLDSRGLGVSTRENSAPGGGSPRRCGWGPAVPARGASRQRCAPLSGPSWVVDDFDAPLAVRSAAPPEVLQLPEPAALPKESSPSASLSSQSSKPPSLPATGGSTPFRAGKSKGAFRANTCAETGAPAASVERTSSVITGGNPRPKSSPTEYEADFAFADRYRRFLDDA
ncbi:unnamed protein product [Polarella glacialis]|uniref:Uncharacterized protein n=1 Tax=Polarella glacialis TaxID=89957 RepID=A0A813E6I2_POLGL|nr:unnamed protein product [Polarella glacialis]